MRWAVSRCLAALLPLLCVLAGCNQKQERSVPLSEIVNASKSARGTRIQATATATYSDPEWRILFMQDHGVGMFLTLPPDSRVDVGDRVQIVGKIAAPGELQEANVSVLSTSGALPVSVKVNDYSLLPAFFSQFVEVSGTVQWAGMANGRATVQLATAGRELPVYFRRALEQDLPVVGSLVTVAGVAAADFDGNGKFRGPKLFSPSVQQLHIVKSGPADPFSIALKPLAQLKNVLAGTLVHVTGEITNEASPSVGDGAMTIPIRLGGAAQLVPGVSDITGFWNGELLQNVVARTISHQLAKNGDIVHLAELKHLTVATASAQRPVSVRAVVTYVDREWGLLFVQDETAAAYVDFHNIDIHLQPGDLVDVSGVSGPGGYAPQIDRPQIGFVRRAHLPEPLEINLSQQNMAEADSRWCRIRGVIHTAREHDGRTVWNWARDPRT